MAKTVTTTLRVSHQGDGINDSVVLQAVNNAGIPSIYYPNAANVAGSAFGPTGSGLGVILVPPKSMSGQPSVSAVSKVLGGSTGDVGIPLDPSAPIIAPSSLSITVVYGAGESAFAIFT